MKRVVMIVALFMLLPAMAGAQMPPPAPPAPPTPAVAPLPPLPPDYLQLPPVPPTPAMPPAPPVPPRAVAAPTVMEAWELEQMIREAREAAERVQVDREAIRATAAQAAEEAARVRLLIPPFHEMPDIAWDYHAFGQRSPSDGSYSSGLSHLMSYQYERAIVDFDRVIAQRGTRTDGALYHKAWAQFRLGRTEEAQATLAQLRKDYPQSRYLNDAKALEADARRLRPDQITNDDEIKLLAINSMQHSEPERAIPLLEGVLNANNSLRVKKAALYVLALSNQARAHQILLSYAKGAGNPDLQYEAIKYLSANRDKQTTSAELRQIYESTTDVAVRSAIIRAYQSAGDKVSLVSIAQATTAPVAIRSQAISGLTNIAAPQELWALYQKEQDKTLRLQMVRAFASMGAIDQLSQVVKIEKEPEVRRQAIRSLGSMRTEKTGQMLVDLYGTEQDRENRKAVISALYSQQNADALISIARKESTIELKTEIVRRLSDMAPRSKAAADYLMEIIK